MNLSALLRPRYREALTDQVEISGFTMIIVMNAWPNLSRIPTSYLLRRYSSSLAAQLLLSQR